MKRFKINTTFEEDEQERIDFFAALSYSERLKYFFKLRKKVSFNKEPLTKGKIYDIRRQYDIHYDLHDTQFIMMDFNETNKADNVIAAFTEDEGVYQHLWKNYFNSVNIPSRKNMKLHIRHIPERYWKHLPEKI